MELFSQFIGWQNYVSVSLAEADVAENDAETAVKYAEATALVETWTGAKEDRVTVARAERELAPDVRKARDAYNKAYAHRKRVSVLVDNFERSAALISRELSRRIGREPVDRRQLRWNP